MFAKWRRRAPIDDEERAPLLSAVAAAPHAIAASRPHDIDLLSRLGGAYGAAQAGQLPSTEQICSAFRALLDADVLQVDAPAVIQPSRFSASGRQVVLDMRALLEALIIALQAKNGKDELQEFWWHTRHAKPRVKPDVELPDMPNGPSVTAQQVQDDASALLDSLQTLASLILANVLATSTGLIDDLVYLVRAILADSAAEVSERTDTAAEALRPPERHHREEREVTADDVEEQAETLQDTLAAGASALGEAGGQAKGLNAKLASAAQQDTRQVIMDRLQQLVERIRTDPTSRDAVVTILALAERYLAEVESASDAVTEAIDQTELDVKVDDPGQHATMAVKALRAVIEALSQRSLSGALSAAQACAKDAQDNDAIATYVHDLHTYSRTLLTSGDAPPAEETLARIEELYDRGRELLASDPAWRRDAAKFNDEIDAMYIGAKEDRGMQAVGEALRTLLADLGSFGRRGFYTLEGEVGDLWRDLANVILPRLLRYLQHLSVPRTEVVTPYADVVVDDLRLADLVILPTFARLTQRTDLVFDRPPSSTGTLTLDHATGTLSLHGLSFTCAGVSLAFGRKLLTWLPYLRRFSSLAEVALPLPGLTLSVTYTRLSPDDPDRTSWLRFDAVDASLPTLTVRMHKSSHPVLTWCLGHLASPIVRHVLASTLQSQLQSALQNLDTASYDVASDATARGGHWQAWLRALLHASPRPSAPDRSSATGLRATKVGVIKDDPDMPFAVAVGGAPQLVDGDIAGPGYDSARQVVEDAVEATPAVPPVDEAIDTVREGVDEVQEAAEREARKSGAKDTWRSSAFDLA